MYLKVESFNVRVRDVCAKHASRMPDGYVWHALHNIRIRFYTRICETHANRMRFYANKKKEMKLNKKKMMKRSHELPTSSSLKNFKIQL